MIPAGLGSAGPEWQCGQDCEYDEIGEYFSFYSPCGWRLYLRCGNPPV